MEALPRLMWDEAGQDVVEHGLIIAAVAIMVLVATTAFGAQVQAWFGALAGRITTTGSREIACRFMGQRPDRRALAKPVAHTCQHYLSGVACTNLDLRAGAR